MKFQQPPFTSTISTTFNQPRLCTICQKSLVCNEMAISSHLRKHIREGTLKLVDKVKTIQGIMKG